MLNTLRRIKAILCSPRSGGSLLVSRTLDMDDARLAKSWLGKKSAWHNIDEIQNYHSLFASFNGSSFAYSFLSGRVSLSAIISALELKPGDEVIVPGYTCVVVPNAFSYAGVEVKYCDIELDTYGLDASLLEASITPRTKAVLIHHLYGLVCRDYERLIEVAHYHGLRVIEDCAHSTGAEYKSKKIGNLGDVAFYSSERSKVFTTLIGGMATTNDPAIASRLEAYYSECSFPDDAFIERQLKNIILSYYRVKHPGRLGLEINSHKYDTEEIISTTPEEENGMRPGYYGQKMPNPIAAIGTNQLKKIDAYNARRRETAKRWDAWCDRNGYKKAVVIPDSTPVFLRYPVMVEPEKKQNRAWVEQETGGQVGVWFSTQIHPTSRTVEGCPNAAVAVRQCINLPALLS